MSKAATKLIALALVLALCRAETCKNAKGETIEKTPETEKDCVKEETKQAAAVTLEFLEKHLITVEKRLVSIEEKIDHVLFHHSHDVTPHEMKWTPFGPQLLPKVTDPNSVHHQMKMHDYIRGGPMNPYSYAGGIMGAMGGMGGMGGYGMLPMF